MLLPVSGKKMKILKKFMYNIYIFMTNCEAMTSPTHSFEYS